MEDQNELGNNIQNEEEFEDMRTDEEKKTSFKQMYRNPKVLPIVEEPKIYSEDSLRNFLTPEHIVVYTHYKKKKDKNFGKENKMIVFNKDTSDKQYKLNISKKIEELIDNETDKHGEIIRRMLFFKKDGDAHIGCLCLFIDKYSNKNYIFAPNYDYDFIIVPDKYCKDTVISYIPLQADSKSCGIVAIKTANHLDKKWFLENRNNLFDLENEEILPTKLIPKKLLSYKQPDLWKMYEYNNDIFKENFEKGYIKNIKLPKTKTEKNKTIVSDARNVKLQESKSRRLYENYYQQEKAKLDKEDPKYRDQKQDIIKKIEKKYENMESDISNALISP